ncbi:unnamed protein product [Strongylus vulgaris]|uniref:F-box domain-containing protein n=1 Tax=Strongylus vulgaris TaxID=40348 RepID=A0A3P7J4X9_STRVU|nr:unnamed protein product [Strongylus vulgaris]
MAAIYDMTRRVTMHNAEDEIKIDKIQDQNEEEEDYSTDTTIDKLPDKVLQQIFSYLSPYQRAQSTYHFLKQMILNLAEVVEIKIILKNLEFQNSLLLFNTLNDSFKILQSGQVCKRWRAVACSPMLWKFVSFRPNYGGIQVTNHDYFLHLIGTQFSELRIVELTTDLITPNVLYEMANKCPRLQHLTLDFSTAMQLHDFTDLQSFPSRLRSLTLCLSENIFLEGFLRKVYTFISSVELLHIIGTYEKVEDEEEEVYETVNIFKLKQFLPNLRVVNFWGVPFITDEHVDAISSNCAHLECLCVNYCTKVTGSCLKLVLQRCRKLKSLFLAHTSLDNATIKAVEWEKTRIEELDVKGTELLTDTLISLLTRLPYLRWLDASWLENMTDQVLEAWLQSGALGNLQFINLDTCDSLNEGALTEMIVRHGSQLQGLCLGGQHKLLEYFWMNMIPQLKNIRVIVMGIAEDCCAKVAAKIHVDQFIDCIAQNCPLLTRLEIRWDDDTLRFSDKSRVIVMGIAEDCCAKVAAKIHVDQFIDCIAQNCPLLTRLEIRWDDDTLRFSDKSR